MIKVSCIMPTTRARVRFVPRACEYFLRQEGDFGMELVIMSEESVADLVPQARPGRKISLYTCTERSLGEKRNLMHEMARGEYLVPWDDDDWYGRNRVENLLEAIVGSGFDRAGCPQMLFYDTNLGAMKLLDLTTPGKQRVLPTGGMVLKRSLWERIPYAAMDRGHDTEWQKRLPPALCTHNVRDYVCIRHGQNSWDTAYDGPCWSDYGQGLADVMPQGEAAWYASL